MSVTLVSTEKRGSCSHLLFRFPFMRSLPGWPGSKWLLLPCAGQNLLRRWFDSSVPGFAAHSRALACVADVGSGRSGFPPPLELFSPDLPYRNWQLKVVHTASASAPPEFFTLVPCKKNEPNGENVRRVKVFVMVRIRCWFKFNWQVFSGVTEEKANSDS